MRPRKLDLEKTAATVAIGTTGSASNGSLAGAISNAVGETGVNLGILPASCDVWYRRVNVDAEQRLCCNSTRTMYIVQRPLSASIL